MEFSDFSENIFLFPQHFKSFKHKELKEYFNDHPYAYNLDSTIGNFCMFSLPMCVCLLLSYFREPQTSTQFTPKYSNLLLLKLLPITITVPKKMEYSSLNPLLPSQYTDFLSSPQNISKEDPIWQASFAFHQSEHLWLFRITNIGRKKLHFCCCSQILAQLVPLFYPATFFALVLIKPEVGSSAKLCVVVYVWWYSIK